MSVSSDRRLGVVKREILVGARATPPYGCYSCSEGGDPNAPHCVPSGGHPHAQGAVRADALLAVARRRSGLSAPPPCTPGTFGIAGAQG